MCLRWIIVATISSDSVLLGHDVVPTSQSIGRRSGHGSSADETRRRGRAAAPERPCLDHAARGTAVAARYEAIDSEKRRLGPARLGYHRAICTRNRYLATARGGYLPLAQLKGRVVKAREPPWVLTVGAADIRRAA